MLLSGIQTSLFCQYLVHTQWNKVSVKPSVLVASVNFFQPGCKFLSPFCLRACKHARPHTLARFHCLQQDVWTCSYTVLDGTSPQRNYVPLLLWWNSAPHSFICIPWPRREKCKYSTFPPCFSGCVISTLCSEFHVSYPISALHFTWLIQYLIIDEDERSSGYIRSSKMPIMYEPRFETNGGGKIAVKCV